MITVRTLLDNNVWWYLCLDSNSEPFIRPSFDIAWQFQDAASANRVIRHMLNVESMKRYRFEVHELQHAAQ